MALGASRASGRAGVDLELARKLASSVVDPSRLLRRTSGRAGVDLELARKLASSVVDPELPMLTLADLGVLRGVDAEAGNLVVRITPTYSGCPALATMRDDLVRSLGEAGFGDVEVRVELAPAWSSDDITPHGRAMLTEHGISPPGPAPTGPVGLSLLPTRRAIACPRCGSADVAVTSEFGPTACKALYRCTACLEPFEHVKEI